MHTFVTKIKTYVTLCCLLIPQRAAKSMLLPTGARVKDELEAFVRFFLSLRCGDDCCG